VQAVLSASVEVERKVDWSRQMTTKTPKRALTVITAALLALSSIVLTRAQSPTEGAPLTASELQSLVAPIALYPDPLVAQILTAATYPDQVAAADAWYGQNARNAGSDLMAAVNAQSWDPSVKALTQFPSVLHNMASNLSWTSTLGDAYHGQTAAVMSAIQTLRSQAKAAGNLSSGSQITVVQQSPEVIVIQPTNPQVVYVPVYDPAVVYGTAYVVPAYAYVPPPPAYNAGAVVAAGVIGFAAGVAIASSHSSCCVWGYSSWNCGWHGTTTVVYHGTSYPPNTAWHGSYYNGAYHGSTAYNSHPSGYNTYNSSTNTYTHDSYDHQTNSYNQSTYNPTTKTSSENSYNPSTGVSRDSSSTYNSSTHTATTSTTYSDPNHPSSSSDTKSTSTTYNPSTHATTTTSSYGGSSRSGSGSSNSWANSNASRSDAYSGMNGHEGGGTGNSGGWSSNAESSRGWGSMKSSGYSGGRFGGGRAGGGGFRR
jgi:hypothetical protein